MIRRSACSTQHNSSCIARGELYSFYGTFFSPRLYFPPLLTLLYKKKDEQGTRVVIIYIIPVKGKGQQVHNIFWKSLVGPYDLGVEPLRKSNSAPLIGAALRSLQSRATVALLFPRCHDYLVVSKFFCSCV